MDAKNRFLTPATYRLVRSDYLALLAVLMALAVVHWRDIHWGWFLVAFWWIDVVGYLPGTLWYRLRSSGPRHSIPVGFSLAYNVAHSLAVNAAVIGVWYAVAGGWSWTMLAQPIHLCIDRGVFGNIYKSFGLSFEPVVHPAFEKFASEFEGEGPW